MRDLGQCTWFDCKEDAVHEEISIIYNRIESRLCRLHADFLEKLTEDLRIAMFESNAGKAEQARLLNRIVRAQSFARGGTLWMRLKRILGRKRNR